MKCILVLDDDERRHRLFRRLVADRDCEMVGVKSSVEFIKFMDEVKGCVDLVFLDYQLNEKDHRGLTITGGEVALWMMANLLPDGKKVIIHSSDHIGSVQMLSILSNAGFDVEALEMGSQEFMESFAKYVGPKMGRSSV